MVNPHSQWRSVVRGVLQLVLFAGALFFLVPPVVSAVDHPPNTVLPRVISVVLFGASRVLAVGNTRRNLFLTAAEVLLFAGFVWVLGLRLDM